MYQKRSWKEKTANSLTDLSLAVGQSGWTWNDDHATSISGVV